jgi:hypothetical protein
MINKYFLLCNLFIYLLFYYAVKVYYETVTEFLDVNTQREILSKEEVLSNYKLLPRQVIGGKVETKFCQLFEAGTCQQNSEASLRYQIYSVL